MDKRIAKNYILNTAYQILSLIVPLITAPYISRVFGPVGVGTYSYVSSISGFFVMFSVLGRSVYGQREIARCRDDYQERSIVFWEIITLGFVTTCLCTVGWLIFAVSSNEDKVYLLVLTIELVAAFFDISWFYAGLEQFSTIVFRNTLIRVVNTALLFILIKTKDDLGLYIFLMSFGKLLGNGSMWFALRKNVSGCSVKDISIKRHIRATWVYFVPTIASSVYTLLDKVMIEWITNSKTENGYYEEAQKIVKIGYTIVISMNTVMASRMSYLFSKGERDEIVLKLQKGLSFIVLMAIPISLGIAGISGNFVQWYFGKGFEKVSLLLKVSSPLVLIMSVHNFYVAQYLVPSGQRARSTKGILFGAVVNFLSNLFLIQRMQAMGAIIASVLAELAICAVFSYMSKEFISMNMLWRVIRKRIFAGVAMLLIVLGIGYGHQGDIFVTVLQIAVGSMSYFMVLCMIRDEEVISFISGIMRWFRRRKSL